MISKRLLPLFMVVLPAATNAQDMLRLANLESHNVQFDQVEYKKKSAIRIIEKPGTRGEAMALVKGTAFRNGTIEVELAGDRRPESDTTNRGFVGIAFRIQKKDTMKFECFYLRPTNGRSTDQLRRNHSTQYVSEPQYPWYKLRKEFPGVYESYVDLAAGEWTKVKIVVNERQAKLYVHDSPQPCLIVNDLKHTPESGPVALWIGLGTIAHFRNLKVTMQ